MIAERRATIWVIAGPNGAGKSSIIGEMIREAGADYFNPDELTDKLMLKNAGLRRDDANALAWQEGRHRLEEAVSRNQNFAFETTLGGRTITRALHAAADRGMALKIWFIALDSSDRHIERVRKRVSRGGHAVSDELVRARYDASRASLASLMSRAAAVKVYDNSYEASIERGEVPRPRLVLDFAAGRIVNDEDLPRTPDWAKPVVAAALKARRVRR